MVLAGRSSIAYQEYPQNRQINKRKVVKKARISKAKWIIITSFLMVIIFSNLAVQAFLVKQNYQTKTLQNQIRDINRQIVQTRVDMAKLESFDRIQKDAETKLGMKVPGPRDYRCIRVTDQPGTPVNVTTDREVKDDLWSKMLSWFGGIGATMAKDENR